MLLYLLGVDLTDITTFFINAQKTPITTEMSYQEITTIQQEIVTEEIITTQQEMVVAQQEITTVQQEITTTQQEIKTSPLTDYETRLIASVLECEFSPDISIDGAVITCIVIRNRIYSDIFPNTAEGVVYQSGQFSCVSYIDPSSVSDKAIEIVNDVFTGYYHGWDFMVDSTLYFCNQYCDFSSWATLIYEYWYDRYCVKVYS